MRTIDRYIDTMEYRGMIRYMMVMKLSSMYMCIIDGMYDGWDAAYDGQLMNNEQFDWILIIGLLWLLNYYSYSCYL